MTTHVYRTVEGCEIRADVYRPAGEGPFPVVAWFHGGALIRGGRRGVPENMRDLCRLDGYALVSFDYRLAPETKLPAILDDVTEACRWARKEGPALFGADPERLAVAGSSAGGYLALVAGYRAAPAPKALVAFYGYGDIAGAWYSKPSPFYRKMEPVGEERALAVVGTKPVSDVKGGADRRRGQYYLYCRQRGLWPKLVAGLDPEKEPEAFGPFSPLENVTEKYPPTMLLHGDKDTDVPHEQSALMAGALKRAGVEHEFITVPDGGHGFNSGKRPHPDTPAIMERVRGFLRKHLGAGEPEE